jgi:hypothetical protein
MDHRRNILGEPYGSDHVFLFNFSNDILSAFLIGMIRKNDASSKLVKFKRRSFPDDIATTCAEKGPMCR